MLRKTSKLLLSLTLLAPTALLAATPVVTPVAQAADSETLSGALGTMQANLSSLNSQAGELQGQISDVGQDIAKLEVERGALQAVLTEKQTLLKGSIREAYMSDNPSSLEVLASNDTFSGVVSQQSYQDEISQKTKTAAEQLAAVQQQIDQKLAEAKQKQDGLLALKGQFDDKVATAQAQVESQQALLTVTQGKEEEYQKMRVAAQQEEAAALVATSPTPAAARPSAAPSASPGPVNSVRGGNPYPYGQCTWYVYNAAGRGQMGNAGTWRATSSTPGVGKIMIWRSGQQGAAGAGHVGVVIGVNGNSVTIRHMNWNGWGVVSTGTFQSTGMFY